MINQPKVPYDYPLGPSAGSAAVSNREGPNSAKKATLAQRCATIGIQAAQQGAAQHRWVAVLLTLALSGTLMACSSGSNSSNASAAEKPASGPALAASSSAPALTGSPSPPASIGSPSAPASAPAASPATASPAAATTAGNGTELGAYTFNLTNGYSAPLGPTAPTQAEIASGGSCDVQYNGEIYSCNQEKIISLPSGSTPTYSACTTGTIFEDEVNPTQGNVFCIIETSGQVAGVTVAAAGSSPNNYVTLTVTVWKYVS